MLASIAVKGISAAGVPVAPLAIFGVSVLVPVTAIAADDIEDVDAGAVILLKNSGSCVKTARNCGNCICIYSPGG